MSKEEGWTVTIINDDDGNGSSYTDDLPITVTKNSLRKFVLEILKEKGLLQEDPGCQKKKNI